MYESVNNGAKMPDIFDDYPKNDSPVMKKMRKLIIQMTSHNASDRPSAEDVASVLKKLNAQVNLLQPSGDVDPSLRLLQALNDNNQTAIDERIAAPAPKRKLLPRLKDKLTIKKVNIVSNVKDLSV